MNQRRGWRWIPIVLLVVAGGRAAGGERDLKEARADIERAARDDDAAALAKAVARLARMDPPRGAVELVAELDRERRVALVARDELAHAGDPRVARALADRLASLREPRARRLLAAALAGVPGDEVSRALVRALEDRDASVRAAAAAALGARGGATAALAAGHLRERALRDPSPRVQRAAAVACEKLGERAPPGFDVVPGTLGLPSRFFARRVAFLIDASRDARAVAFVEPPGLSSVAPLPSATLAAIASPARPKLPAPRRISAYDAASEAFASALVRLRDDQTFDLVAFAESPTQFAAGPSKATAHEVAAARDWLQASTSPAAEDRDVLQAIEKALDPADGPAPEEIWLAITGVPAGRAASGADAAAAVAERAWDRDITIHVLLLELEDDGPPPDERERVLRVRRADERRTFAEALARPTGGSVIAIPLLRPVAGGTPPPRAASRPASAPMRPRTSRERAALRRRGEEALHGRDDDTLASVAPELARSTDVASLACAVRILEEGSTRARLATLEGFHANAAAAAPAFLARELRARTDATRAALVARALGVTPGPAATKALVAEAARRDGQEDLVRIIFTLLADRSPDELAPLQTDIVMVARHARGGLAALEARRALAIARSRLPESRPGAGVDRLLPEHFCAAGVALLVDTEAAIDEPFAAAPPAASTPASPRAAPSPATKPGPRGAAATAARGDPPLTESRRAVLARELRAALDVLDTERARVNVIPLADIGPWRATAASLAKGGLADARAYVERLSATPDRQALPALERALDDPGVEEVWVITAGVPTRSDADRDPAAVVERVRGLWLRRGVRVNVVLALGEPVGPDAALARAERADEARRIEEFWRPIATATGGTLVVRTRVRAALEPAPPSRRGGIADIASPTKR